MKNTTMIKDLTQGSVAKSLITFALPFLLSNLLQTAYNLIDMIIVGQYVGSVGMTAVNTGGHLAHMLTNLCIGFSAGGRVLISQLVGAEDRDGLNRTIGTMITVLGIGAAALSVLGIVFSGPMLSVMNTPPEAVAQARDYLIVSCAGLIFVCGYNAVTAIFTGMGDSKHPLIFIAIASVINLVLDLVFVAGFHMESFGAALATVISQTIAFAISVIYLYLRRESFAFDFKASSLIPDRDKLRSLLKLGLPMAFQTNAISLSMLFVNSFVNSFGITAAAVTAAGMKISSINHMITASIMSAGSAMIGQNTGARKPDRSAEVVKISMIITCLFCVFNMLIAVLFTEQLFGMFTSDPDVIALSGTYVWMLVIAASASALMAPFNALVNGIGYASLSLIIALLDGVVGRILLCLLFGKWLGWGLSGYWFGNSIAGFITVILAGAYYFSGRWRSREPVSLR